MEIGIIPSIRNLDVALVSVDELSPYAGNPRTHTKKQVRQIAKSIATFGWTNPILVDGVGGVIAGHGRLAAAIELGIEAVPTIRLDHLTEAQKRAYVIADNRLAENAGWDRETLAIELQTLSEFDLDFDIETIGFEMGEIDLLIDELSDDGDAVDDVPEPDHSLSPVTEIRDLWLLGRHRLLCADSRDPSSYDCLMGGEQAEMVFTDPPYNVPIGGHVSGLGKTQHGEFAMAAGEMTEAQFIGFLERVFQNLSSVSVDGAIHFICMDWRHLYELLVAGRAVYDEIKNLCVWAKNNGGMGSLYRSRHELVAVFKHGVAPHINNVELGQYGRNRTNVWEYAGMSSFGGARDEELVLHPTVKPVGLVEDAIKDCSRRDCIVLDAFAGSGTTLIAAERAGRRGFGIELDPHYVDVALERFRHTFGEEPIHAASGMTFSELK